MVFGSSYPAHIRIRSKYITEEHARLEVDENGKVRTRQNQMQ